MEITLHGSVAEMLNNQVTAGNYQSPEDLVYEALEALVKQKIDQGINEGLADMEAGRVMEINADNLQAVLSKPVSEW